MVNFKQLLGKKPINIYLLSVLYIIEKATAEDLSEPDWETILEIVEEIKTKNVSLVY